MNTFQRNQVLNRKKVQKFTGHHHPLVLTDTGKY